MNICECLTTTAKLFPDRIAVVFGDRQWTFRELEQKSQAAAAVFQQHDIKPGDRVALMLVSRLRQSSFLILSLIHI